jgi:branched-chain amino acid transport system ATP-binding protein
MPAAAPSIRCHDIEMEFQGVKALDGMSLELAHSEILGLIGPNGAGKTTLVDIVSGFRAPTAGRVELFGSDATRWPPRRRARAGLCRSFQGSHSFGFLTVAENVEVAALSGGLGRGAARSLTAGLLERFRLAGKAEHKAETLAHGEERRLGIARALAIRPRTLLLDEPAAGLNEAESDELVALLREIRDDFELALLVIEHDMSLIMRLCERIHVIDHGKTLAVGTPDEVRSHRGVREAYLGVDEC